MTQRLGEYELIRELGTGAMGSVFLARHVSLGREVAIKLLAVTNERNLARFESEAQAVARLQHPHVVKLHEAHLAASRPYLVMSLVEGQSLDERLQREGPMQPAAALAVALQLADALAHAHELGLLHRDVKPANVLLDAAGAAYLTDFGLAKDLASTREALTLTGQIVGTPAFMSPEQATGDRAAIGPPTDVYGLGATLYAMLSGRAPHERTNMMALVAAVAEEAPTSLSALLPELDPGLARVVERCLEKAPKRRYRDAGELLRDLERVQAGERVAARPRAPSWLLAMPLLAALFGVGVLALRAAVTPPDPPDRPRPAPMAASTSPVPTAPSPQARLSSDEQLGERRWRDGSWKVVKRWPPGVDACTGLLRNNQEWLLAVTREGDGTSVRPVPLVPGLTPRAIWSGRPRSLHVAQDLRRVFVVTERELLVAHPRAVIPTGLSSSWQTLLTQAPLIDVGRGARLMLLTLTSSGAQIGYPDEGPRLARDALVGIPRERRRAWLSPDGRYLLGPALVDGATELRCSVLDPKTSPKAASWTVPIVAEQVAFLQGWENQVIVTADGIASTILFALKLPELRPVRRLDLPIGLRIVATSNIHVFLGGAGTLYRWDGRKNEVERLRGSFPTTWGPTCASGTGHALYCATSSGIYERQVR